MKNSYETVFNIFGGAHLCGKAKFSCCSMVHKKKNTVV